RKHRAASGQFRRRDDRQFRPARPGDPQWHRRGDRAALRRRRGLPRRQRQAARHDRVGVTPGRNSRHKDLMDPSELIARLIAELIDWRGQTFAAIRKSILAADPEVIEEWKWMGSPVWSRDGIIAVANAHKGKVKLTFMHGASLPDPDQLFNAG